ncbi:hypothetical protein [Pedobacter nyackensis]|nr:hypothetical protein [Pedobacter nyackensis]
MMKKIICCLSILVLNVSLAFCQKTQPSLLFENYKQNKSQSLLPDFSYAGYHCGEKAIFVPEGYKIFNVVDFGAKPDDELSDAITAANNNGSGIVFFPKGRFLVNPKQMWTGPPMFTFTAKGTDAKIGEILETANVGEFKLKLRPTKC